MAAASLQQLVSLESPIFRAYVFYGALLVLKVLAMVPLTARQRVIKKVFASPEDAMTLKNAKVKYDDPDVERVRRGHLNDLENIPQFLVACLFYILTDPSAFVAINLMRVYTIARYIHTFVYVIKPMPQPTRGIAFGVALIINIYMAVVAVLAFSS